MTRNIARPSFVADGRVEHIRRDLPPGLQVPGEVDGGHAAGAGHTPDLVAFGERGRKTSRYLEQPDEAVGGDAERGREFAQEEPDGDARDQAGEDLV